jgi:hypothetical protein
LQAALVLALFRVAIRERGLKNLRNCVTVQKATNSKLLAGWLARRVSEGKLFATDREWP